MIPLFDYEALVADFNQKLVTQLRGHSADAQYLDTWVPDEDPIKSILNMVESAQSAGCKEMRIRFAAATMDEAQRRELLGAVSELGRARLVADAASYELSVAGPAGS